MRFSNVAIPLGYAWSSPFTRWQGSLAELSSLDLAVDVTRRALEQRKVDPAQLEGVVLGWTVPQPNIFYGAPTLAGRIGAPGISGPMVSQACATSVASLDVAAGRVAAGGGLQLVVATDRTSNGPQLLFPRPSAQGGAPLSTHWVIDSFSCDPWAEAGMLEAAERVAAEAGISRQELDEVTALRYEQYTKALADDRAFQRRYFIPVEIPESRTRDATTRVEADEGVRPVVLDKIRELKPAVPGGRHTFATQTHPADGCAGALVTTGERARELVEGEGIVEVLATGYARVAKSHMPEAPVPAAEAALRDAELEIDRIDAVVTHNPFAVNDIYFSRETGYPLERMNLYGSSLIFGHPQGPTGLRLITELIEQLRLRGGGVGLFTGCAAGDTAGAIVIRVTD